LEIKVVDLGIGTGVGVDVHMHKVECELMGGSRGDEVRIWTDVPLQGWEGVCTASVLFATHIQGSIRVSTSRHVKWL
jgi:hypothetical protein